MISVIVVFSILFIREKPFQLRAAPLPPLIPRQSNTTMAKLNLKNNNNRNSGGNNTKKRRRRRASNDTMSSSSNDNNQKTILIAIILGLCLVNILDVDISIGRHTNSSSGGGGRRSLLSSLYLSGPSTLLPWAQHHLVDVTDRPTETETALFWRKLFLFVFYCYCYIVVVVPDICQCFILWGSGGGH